MALPRPVFVMAIALAVGGVVGCGTSSEHNMQQYSEVAGQVATAGLFCAIRRPCRDPGLEYAVLRGRVLEPRAFGSQPVCYARVALQQAGQEIAAASTDRSGTFAFTGELPDGTYDLVLDSDRLVGTRRVVLEGTAQTVDIVAAQK